MKEKIKQADRIILFAYEKNPRKFQIFNTPESLDASVTGISTSNLN